MGPLCRPGCEATAAEVAKQARVSPVSPVALEQLDAPAGRVTHCLQTNRSSNNSVLRASEGARREGASLAAAGRAAACAPSGARESGAGCAMPCRRPGGEHFLLLERAVSLPGGAVGASSGSKEVDALVAKLGEVLQLSAQRRAPPAPRLPPKLQGRDRAAPYSSPRGLGFLASLHHHRHRHPPPHALSPASLLLLPPSPPSAADREGSPRVAKQLCGRGWLRSAGKKQKQKKPSRLSAGDDDDDEDDDPQRLLQELILSGNLIKEAVRRLQLAATSPSTAPAEASSATASPGSASSTGSCCCHSSSGEGDSAAASAYGVSALHTRP